MGWFMSVVLEEDVGPRITNITEVIVAEFREMPGMRLTRPQVRRLWNLTDEECEQALAFLSSLGLLAQDDTGRYCLSISCV